MFLLKTGVLNHLTNQRGHENHLYHQINEFKMIEFFFPYYFLQHYPKSVSENVVPIINNYKIIISIIIIIYIIYKNLIKN